MQPLPGTHIDFVTLIVWKWFSGVQHVLQKNDYRLTTSATELLNDLEWASPSDRRKDAHFNLFSKAVIGRTAISLNHLSRPTRCTRYTDQSSFIPIATRTDVYKFSIFPRTVNNWNSAPAEVRLKLYSPSDESL